MSRGICKRVLLVDDHPVVRNGIAERIEHTPDLEVCGQADTLRDAMRLVRELLPDGVILDLGLKDGSGLDFLKNLKASNALPPTLVLSVNDESIYAERCLKAGAKGYLMKDSPLRQVVEGIESVMAGQIVISQEVSTRLIQNSLGRAPAEGADSLESLTDREMQVYSRIGRGRSTKEIAAELKLSVKTVETYRSRIMDKLSITSAAALVHHAISQSRS